MRKGNGRKLWGTVRKRWKRHMPKFFKRIFWVCSLVSGTALAANTALQAAGVQPHDWWLDISPYLIGIPAGAAFICKFTVSGGMPDDKKEDNNTILDHDNF